MEGGSNLTALACAAAEEAWAGGAGGGSLAKEACCRRLGGNVAPAAPGLTCTAVVPGKQTIQPGVNS